MYGVNMTKKVLLADDEVMIRTLIAATLEFDERYQVLVARDGEEALTTAQREKPDLVLLDIMMPERNGYEVCRALRGDLETAHIKVIMLTALAQESDRSKALEAGADDYFTKPFSPRALLEKVEEVLSP